jgi:hypothetical protein
MGEGEFCPDTTGESRQKDNNHAGKKTVKLLRVIRDITTSWGENTGYLTISIFIQIPSFFPATSSFFPPLFPISFFFSITLKKGNTSKKRLSENKNI